LNDPTIDHRRKKVAKRDKAPAEGQPLWKLSRRQKIIIGNLSSLPSAFGNVPRFFTDLGSAKLFADGIIDSSHSASNQESTVSP